MENDHLYAGSLLLVKVYKQLKACLYSLSNHTKNYSARHHTLPDLVRWCPNNSSIRPGGVRRCPNYATTGRCRVDGAGKFPVYGNSWRKAFHFFPEIAHHGPYRNLKGIIWTPPVELRPFLDTHTAPFNVYGNKWTHRWTGGSPSLLPRGIWPFRMIRAPTRARRN